MADRMAIQNQNWLWALTILLLLLLIVVVTLAGIYIPKLNNHIQDSESTNGMGGGGTTSVIGATGPTGSTGGVGENTNYIYRSNIEDNDLPDATPVKLLWIDNISAGGGITYAAGNFTFTQAGLYQVSVTSIGFAAPISDALEIWVGTTNTPGASLSYTTVVPDADDLQQGQLSALINVGDGDTLSIWVRQSSGSPATLSTDFVPSCGFVLLVPA